MSEAFLKGVAKNINTAHQGEFKDVIILSPNRRAALFLQKELNKLQDKPIWSPKLFTIDDWVRHHSDYAEADRLSCIYHLFKIWRKRIHADEKFENFYFWGDKLMNDFDRIDKYLVNEDRLFTTITEEKEIEAQFSDWEEELKEYLHQFWSSIESSTQLEDEHDQIQAFLALWHQIGDIKKELEHHLKEDRIAHSGMMYRSLAQNIHQLKQWETNKIYIVGFNRLNRCEEKIIDYCINNLQAKAYWNYDENLLFKNSDYNDAGRFLKKRGESVEQSKSYASNWKQQSKEVNYYGVIRQAGQAKFIGEILDGSGTASEDTMIILPDEALLLPLLGALPDDLESVNVSMGVALKETPMFTLVEAYLSLHQNFDPEHKTYHRSDVLKLISHPYIPAKPAQFKHLHIELEELNELNNEVLELLFHPVIDHGGTTLFDQLLEAMKQMHTWHIDQQQKGGGLAEYNAEVIVFAYQRIMKLKAIYDEQEMELDFPALIKLIRHYFKNARIPFKGEPLQGLQILGPLEARNLDFKQVIIPNMNEGVFPGEPSTSLIPFHLQKAFGLPTYEDEMAEYAYYFYMALARSQNVHLLYNVIPDDIGAKEQSRFLQNLEILELPNWNIRDRRQIQEAGLKPAAPIIIQKDKAIRNAIKRQFKNGISPSAINTYMQCQLKYYFRYIEELREKETYQEGFRSENIGKVLHKSMEILYKDFKGKNVGQHDIKSLEQKANGAVQSAIQEELGITAQFQNEGEAMLIKKLVDDYVHKILKYDMERAPFILHEHELKLENKIPIDAEEMDHIVIKGRIDRLDEKAGVLRIIDYKTGNVGYGKEGGRIYSISSLLDIEEKRHKEALQLFLYALAIQENRYEQNKDLSIGLYTVRELAFPEHYDARVFIKPKGARGDNNTTILELLTEEHISEFKASLVELVNHMLDPEIEIKQTEDEKICQYCPYIQICKRR